MMIEERLEKIEKELAELKQEVIIKAREVCAYTHTVEDNEGKTRGALTMVKDRVGLVLFDAKGQSRVRLAETAAGPHLRLEDENGKPRIVLSLYENLPSLQIFGEAGEVIWSAPLAEPCRKKRILRHSKKGKK
ncbi:MAG: hypothetical protein PHE84_10450 [bacterium]|nr:hypothetical protein [bacterium]